MKTKYDFDHKAQKAADVEAGDDTNDPQTKKKQKKYFPNPSENWGPKPRATGK